MSSTPSSPRNTIKFLCSHGGKILPRPADGHLKYVGGETRIISVPRDIKFHELMKNLTTLIEDDMVLKYQLVPEDLESLVSVRSDEDLRHMVDEYDRCERSSGTRRLRAFLFPSKPIVLDHAVSMEPLEQRYIDAVNGIIRAAEARVFRVHPPQSISHASFFGISSACSSPRSPESFTSQDHFMQINNYLKNRSHHPIHKVHSSPSICNPTSQQTKQEGGFHQFHSYKNNKHNSSSRGNGYCMRCVPYHDFREKTDSLSACSVSMGKRNGSVSLSPLSVSPRSSHINVGSTDS